LGGPMRQLLRMRARWLGCVLSVALAGCSLPAPYQTYSPGTATPATPPSNSLTVYGATTTTPDMVPDSSEPEPIAAPATPPAPGQNGVAICYNRLWNKPNAVKSAAVEACGGANSSPRVVSQGVDLDACPVLTPTKAVFTCGAAAISP